MADTTTFQSQQLLKRQVLGKGSYGTVSLASPVNSAYGDFVLAVKSADIDQSSSLVEEERFLYSLRGCPQIIHCYGSDSSVENGRWVFNLLLEYAPGGTLADLIDSSKNNVFGVMPEHEVGWYTYLLLLGLKHIHEQGFVHCDFKPANILVFPTQDGILNNLKIADHGLAKRGGDDTTCPTLVKNHWFNYRGTPLYSSPESVMGVHESAMDVWSLGCIAMEMLTGKPAYPESSVSQFGDCNLEDLLLKIVYDHNLPKLPDQNNISDDAKDFLRRCFVRNVEERWSVEQLLRHPFIVDHVKILRELGLVTEPEAVKDAGPTSWWSSKSLFLDASTTQAPFIDFFGTASPSRQLSIVRH